MKKPSARPQWMSLVTAFSPELWGMVLAAAVASLSFATVYSHVHPRRENPASSLIVNMVGMFVDESQPIMRRLRYTKLFTWFIPGYGIIFKSNLVLLLQAAGSS